MSSASSESLRIVVAGYLVRGPLGGSAWQYLQYALGLKRMGHDVFFVEDSDDVPWSCYDPSRGVSDADPTFGLAFAEDALERAGFGDKWAYYDAHTQRWLGPHAEHVLDACTSADILVNVSGSNPVRPWLAEIPTRVFVDTDPTFTQIRHLTDAQRRERASAHTHFLSFGANIGHDDCSVPADGLNWQPTRQPVVLDAWPVTPGRDAGLFTTVMQWDSYPGLEFDGVLYGLKSDSFEEYLDLPQHKGAIFELSMGSNTAPRDRLRAAGWLLRNPLETAHDPWTYQRYIQDSRAEFTIAKHGYVVTNSGWFSERSTSYMASGRPVVVQNTGSSTWLPSGEGVLEFTTPAEASAQIDAVQADYQRHCLAARELIEEFFDAHKVLTALIDSATTRRGTDDALFTTQTQHPSK